MSEWMDLPPPAKKATGVMGLKRIQVHGNVRIAPPRQADEESLPESLPPTPATINLITDDESERTPLREEATTPVIERPLELSRNVQSMPQAASQRVPSPPLRGKNMALLADMPRASPMSDSTSSSSDESEAEENLTESLAERIREERIRREAFGRIMTRGLRRLERLRQAKRREAAELQNRLEAVERTVQAAEDVVAAYRQLDDL